MDDVTSSHSHQSRDLFAHVSMLRPVCAFVLFVWIVDVGALFQENCDTNVWTVDNGAVGVQHVTGSCAEGRIEWRSPYGAVRVSLQASHQPGLANSSLYESCFLASTRFVTIKVFVDDPASGLTPLLVLTPDVPSMKKELCVTSPLHRPVLLYMESELDPKSAAVGLVQISYENRVLPSLGHRQPNDCRPCTDMEIVEAVCTSDLVFAGMIADVTHKPEVNETALHLTVTRMIRQRKRVFRDPRAANHSLTDERRTKKAPPRLKYQTQGGATDTAGSRSIGYAANVGRSDGVLYAPYACHIRKGVGEFLFVGTIRFNRAYLQCAPRIQEFVKLWTRAGDANRIQCTLV